MPAFRLKFLMFLVGTILMGGCTTQDDLYLLNGRIDVLEKRMEKQNEQIAKLSQQLEMAYQKVQDIALKAVESSSHLKSMAGFPPSYNDQARKPSQDKS